MISKILIFCILILFVCCKSNNIRNIENKTIINDSINLYVFIGKKISFTQTLSDETKYRIEIDKKTGDTTRYRTRSLDSKFNAKYRVIRNVYNDLNTNTIKFIVYDHAGSPRVDAFKYVVLYIIKDKNTGKFYHLKYQYQVVEKTKTGNWIGKNGKTIVELFREKKQLIENNRIIFK